MAALSEKKSMTGFGGGYGRPLLCGLIAGVIGIGAMMLLCAFGASAAGAPVSVLPMLVIAALVAGGFIGGFAAAKSLGRKGLLVGAAIGILLSLILLVAASLYQKGLPEINGLTKCLILVVSAMIGGVLGVSSRPKRRRR